MARQRKYDCVRKPVSTRLNLEQFEKRLAPAVYVVKSTADGGPDTLRAAITAMNTTPAGEASTITFSFMPGGPLLFMPLSPYPTLNRKATFLTDTATEKRVEINGLAAGPTAAGLVFTAGGYIEDVAITGWMGFGVSLLGGKTTVIDSYIGTDHGGTKAIGNKSGGINIMSSANTIFNCVVSGNGGPGVQLKGAGAGGNSISSSQIGVGGDSVTAIKNAGAGIFCDDAPGNLFGTSLFGNVVSGNDGTGIHIKGPNAIGNKIVASYIGVGKDGSAQPNKLGGVFIEGGSSTTIGGAGMTDFNVISSNFLHGVAIIGVTGKDNLLRGNKIGVGIDGMADRGNKFAGVFIGGGASLNFVGKPAADHANIIAFNGSDLGAKGHGVVLAPDAGMSNVIQWNSIYKNHGRGIDLNADWVTINDATKLAADKKSGDGDPDMGPNGLQDYPMVVSRPNVGISDFGVHKWSLNSKGSSTFTIDFYDNTGLPLGEYAEGKTYITGASQTVVTNVYGNVEFDFDHTGYSNVTATATDSMGNTSEFSMVDTDADGLADVWEIYDGLDINEDDILTTNELVLIGSNVNRKDLFVEVDAMTGQGPSDAVFFAATPITSGGVIKAFAAATNANVHNPDLADGIDLHVVYDEKTINPEDFALDTDFTRFHQIKNGMNGTGTDGRFGTAAQRGDNTNWVQIRQALSLTYRYSMFASKYSFTSKDAMGNVNLDGKGNPIIIDSSSGLGELHGNDFFVTFGAKAWNEAPFVLTDVDKAGTWMHELGHTLGLNHGGAITDDTNDKPNYHSVMNYLWQFPNAYNRPVAGVGDYGGSWKLNYSGETLNPLNENALIEGDGIKGGAPAFSVPYGDNAGNKALVSSGGVGVDWNFKGGIAGTVPADINFDGKMTVLDGHNDWANLRYYFAERASFASGISEEAHDDEGPRPYQLPHVASVQINDGSAQRSRIVSVTISFDRTVTLPVNPADAFRLQRQSDSVNVGLTGMVVGSSPTVVTLTFSGAATDFTSLADGRYTLTVFDDQVFNGFGLLDGNNDGVPGGNYVLASAPTPNPPTNIFRLFGDADGDGTVAANDFIQFRLALGGTSTVFDFDNDGAVAASDFIQFRLRFGGSI